MITVTRRKLAKAITEMLSQYPLDDVAKATAEYIVSDAKRMDLGLLMQDVADFAKQSGTLNVNIHSSRLLSDKIKSAIEHYLKQAENVDRVYMKEQVDAKLIGGVKIEGPGISADWTALNKLKRLKN